MGDSVVVGRSVVGREVVGGSVVDPGPYVLYQRSHSFSDCLALGASSSDNGREAHSSPTRSNSSSLKRFHDSKKGKRWGERL